MKFNLLTKGYMLGGICLSILIFSCKKNFTTSDTFIIKQWNVALSASYTIPANAGRTDHAVSLLYLMDNNQLYYDIYFDVAPNNGDTPTAVKLYTGAAAENGTLLLDLKNAAFSGNKVKGSIQLNQATANGLLVSGLSFYMVIGSTQITNGLVRGQVDNPEVYAADLNLAPYSSSVNTTATGTAYLRIVSGSTIALSSQIVVNGVPANDVLTAAHIHKTSDGSTVLALANSAADFNKAISTTLTSALSASLQADNLFLDVHSQLYPNGLLKATIR
jgi:hypothetical protein